MKDVTLPDGSKWFAPNACSFGDYGGGGSVGAANLRWLRENFAEHNETMWVSEWETAQLTGYEDEGHYDAVSTCLWIYTPRNLCPNPDVQLVIVTFDYSGEQAFLRDTPDNRELCGGLDDYPCFDDSLISEIEMEWEQEAWESWIKSDLIRTLPEDRQDAAEAMPDNKLFEAYRAAMEEENEYPEPEYNGVHVRVERIAGAFARHLKGEG